VGRLFGTDGIRGIANADLSVDLVDRLARAAVQVLAAGGRGRFAVGRDPRISGDLLEAGLAAGICSAGADVLRLGVIPTPAVAFLASRLEVQAGIVISASHNPMQDNGVKFFAATGFKLPDAAEDQIEALLDHSAALPRPTGGGVGRILNVPDAAEQYLSHLAGLARGRLDGWRIVVDCANGASSWVAPALWERLGATVIPVNAAPDGLNINVASGSTHPDVIQAAVVAHQADVGFAHDGDGDRLIAADRHGGLVDGDTIIGITALHRLARGALPERVVVATVLSNMGLEQALRLAGIRLERVRVGDKYVIERMLEIGARIGGEQSGHVVFLDRATTGDGLVTAIELMNVMLDSGKLLAELRSQFRYYPQVALNVRVADPGRWAGDPEIQRALRQAQHRLGSRGRVLIRASGTEPLVRIMAECEDGQIAQEVARGLSDLVCRRLRVVDAADAAEPEKAIGEGPAQTGR
jgi:phosphoglucosamine mutase